MAASLHQASLCEADIYPTIPCFHSIFPSVSMGCFQFPVMVTATIKKRKLKNFGPYVWGRGYKFCSNKIYITVFENREGAAKGSGALEFSCSCLI